MGFFFLPGSKMGFSFRSARKKEGKERKKVRKEERRKCEEGKNEGLEIKMTSHETKFPQIKPMRI